MYYLILVGLWNLQRGLQTVHEIRQLVIRNIHSALWVKLLPYFVEELVIFICYPFRYILSGLEREQFLVTIPN